MTNHQQLMTITMEECGELIQSCSKMMRHADRASDIHETQRKNLVEEVGDVLCMIMLMLDNGYVTEHELEERINVKRKKLKKWSDLLDGE